MINTNPLLNRALENLKKMEAQLLEESRILSGICDKEGADIRELDAYKAGLEEKNRTIADLNSALAAQASALEKAERETASMKASLDREIQVLRDKFSSKGSEAAALQGMVETLRAELAEKAARNFSLQEELATQRKLIESLSREHEAKDAELRSLLEKERGLFMLDHEKFRKDAAAREKELLAGITPLKEEVWRKTEEAERARAELSAGMNGRSAEFSSRLEKERAEADAALEKARERFLSREKELLDDNRSLKEAAVAAGLDIGRLKQEALDARAECAALRGELEAAAVKMAEQNILARSAISALKELKEDHGRLKSMLGERESDLSGLSAETGRLSAEAREEKKRSAGLNEKLARELELKDDMGNILREAVRREEALKRKVEILSLELKDKSSVIAYLTKELNAAGSRSKQK